MKIFVCVKHVPDSAARIELTAKTEFNEAVTFIMNPYDENAVEAAAQLKKLRPGSDVVAVTLGRERAVDCLRTAMAMGADRGILIRTDTRPDSVMTAKALSAAMVRDGGMDLVLGGRVAIDTEGMQTLFRLAAALSLPVATNVVRLEVGAHNVKVQRQVDGNTHETIHMPFPCVIGTGKALNTPRYPKFPDIMKARKKPVDIIDLATLAVMPPPGGVELLALRPAVEQRKGITLSANPQEAVTQLVDVLTREEKVI